MFDKASSWWSSEKEGLPDSREIKDKLQQKMDEQIVQIQSRPDEFKDSLDEEGVGPFTEPSIREGRPEEVETFFRLLEEAYQDLWPGCKEFKKLEAVVRLYQIKCLSRMPDEIFTTLLELIKRMLPEGDYLPESCYKAKKLIIDLGLTYVKIDACPNDCMIYWKDTSDLTCARFVVNQDIKLPTQRIGREKRSQLRLCDSSAWKHLDNLYPDFASKIQNVRLGLASDGFNPFGKMRNDHSTWPVVLSVYNLPPWMCMKQPNLLLSLLILGPRSPGKEIDVYMHPLIDELNELWEDGVHMAIKPVHIACMIKNLFTCRRVVKFVIWGIDAFLKIIIGFEGKPQFLMVVESIVVHKGSGLQLLPFAIRLVLPKTVTMILLELSAIFRQLCSKESKEGFKELSSRIALTLCQLEKIFPPTFFDIMVHLPVHLADEAAFAGPVPYRWMYPIERYLQTFKRYVRNKGHPEGSIAEAYLMNSSYHANDMLISQDLHWLANYPRRVVSRYKSHIVHGFRFHIKSMDDKHKNQNCGVFVPVNVPGAIGQVNCYGRVVDMFEVKYCGPTEAGDRGRAVMLFKCEWVNSESPRGMKTDQYGFTMVNFNQLGFKEDPFILASQALQAFYVDDTIEKDWHVVVRTQPRDLFDVLEDSDAIDDYAIPNLDDQILDNENFHTRVGVEETPFLDSLALPIEFVNHANVDDELTDDDGE
ncbi:uncharacterized protein [Malus domestica]|uniref:uncharacterized protein n=1 Tax=Malus domestica TaxID=3750 RepID=UPI0039750181